MDPKVQWANDKCDKYDYLISVFCGAAAGAIDVFFVGMPGASKAGKIADATADEMVKGFARMMGWKPGVGGASNPASAIGFLEPASRSTMTTPARKLSADSFGCRRKTIISNPWHIVRISSACSSRSWISLRIRQPFWMAGEESSGLILQTVDLN